MNLTTPEWLARHQGRLLAGVEGNVLFVVLGDQPQYRLVPVPIAGKFGCAVSQTVNGKRLDKGGAYATAEEAIQGGLEDLRTALGW